MAFLTDEQLDVIAGRVFGTRESTLEQEGRKLELTDLIQTVNRVRHRMNSAIDSLPPHAFEPQPDDENGNEVWNAGQIVSHVSQSQLRFTQNVGELVKYTLEPETDDLEMDPAPDMVATKGGIKTATAILSKTLKAIPRDADLTVTSENERFGELGISGWLMLVAIHERSHVKQLEELA